MALKKRRSDPSAAGGPSDLWEPYPHQSGPSSDVPLRAVNRQKAGWKRTPVWTPGRRAAAASPPLPLVYTDAVLHAVRGDPSIHDRQTRGLPQARAESSRGLRRLRSCRMRTPLSSTAYLAALAPTSPGRRDADLRATMSGLSCASSPLSARIRPKDERTRLLRFSPESLGGIRRAETLSRKRVACWAGPERGDEQSRTDDRRS
jgi:hypothetical protein